VRRKRSGKHENGQKRKIGKGIGMIVDTLVTTRPGPSTLMIGITVGIRPGETRTGIGRGVGATHPGGIGIGIIDAATIVQGGGGMIVREENDVGASVLKTNTMTVSPLPVTIALVKTIAYLHHATTKTDKATVTTKPDPTLLDHQLWT
jgi:hypothetical protein